MSAPFPRQSAPLIKGQTMKASEAIPLPPLPEGAPGAPSANRYREQYGVIVTVPDQTEQKRVFESLVKQGFKPRVVVT